MVQKIKYMTTEQIALAALTISLITFICNLPKIILDIYSLRAILKQIKAKKQFEEQGEPYSAKRWAWARKNFGQDFK